MDGHDLEIELQSEVAFHIQSQFHGWDEGAEHMLEVKIRYMESDMKTPPGVKKT